MEQRVKEESDDYRYFLEPDLVPLVPDAAWIEEVRRSLPMLPAARRERPLGRPGARGGRHPVRDLGRRSGRAGVAPARLSRG